MAQRILITAGASGIGKEIASAYAAIGAKVRVCDIDAKALAAAAKDIPGLKTIVCDVSKRDDIERMVAAAVEALGGLDVLVNNAGISGQTAPVEDADPDQWEAVMTVDVIGTFHVTRLSIPHLKKSVAGSIVVMSSVGGRFGYPNRSAYCTAKMGLICAWKLVSYVEKPVDGSAPFYPMGEAPQGIIMYTPDGYMSAQLMRPGRPQFASGDWFRGSDEEIKQEALGYIAYCGPFHTDEEKQTLTHSMFVSLFPNWLGQTQPRVVKIEGNMLHLSTATPIMSGGKKTMSYLSWRRAESNVYDAVPDR